MCYLNICGWIIGKCIVLLTTVMAFHTQQDMPETPLPPIVTRPFHTGFKKWHGFNFLFC